MQYLHIRTYTNDRLEQLVRSHGRGGDGEIDVSFLAAVAAELVRRGVNYIPSKAEAFVQNFGVDQLLAGEIL